jgi:hypothetical protein
MGGLGRKLRNKIERTYDSAVQPFVQSYYVDGFNGVAGRAGTSWSTALDTVEEALSLASSGATIYLTGKVAESITAPLGLFDITIQGVCAGAPRQSTDGGVQAGQSAYWYFASDSTVANLTLRQQGWKFKDVLFQPPASTAATAAGVRLYRDESTYPDASHVIFEDCVFASGGNGIIDTGGTSNVQVKNCLFKNQTGYAIYGASTAIALPLNWHIKDNRFLNFTNGVSLALSYSVVEGNKFSDGGTPTSTCVLSTAGQSAGANNFVVNNFFQTTTANFNTPDVIGNATDVWFNNSIDGQTSMIGRELGTPA